MRTIISIFRRLYLVSFIFVLSCCSLFLAGGNVFADDSPVCTPPASGQPGVHAPVGADAGTFTYQCTGQHAGYWANAYYTFNPATTQRTALYAPDYTYNCISDTWTMAEWDYSPASQTYVQSRVTAPTAPSLPTGCPVPTPITSPSNSTTPTVHSVGTAVAGTGPDSSNTTDTAGTQNSTTTNTNNTSLNNDIYSNATTGNSFVIGNTSAGSAASGDAQAIANIANLLQSSSNVFGTSAVTFTTDINGDVIGDFMFDPAAILASGPGSNNDTAANLQVNANNTTNTNAQINNTIDVGAASGDATVASNTAAGDATSGNAAAIVNLMNLINSTVAAGQSFIGTININGNLNGDILLPQNVLDQLLASSGANSNNSTSTNAASVSTVANNITEAAVNTIASSALTGNASIANNTTAGTATSGNAGTNVTLLNLTGSNTIGKDDLLVFVNVLGKWVGMIMNAPSGSTTAELGGGITSSGLNSNNTVGTTSSSTSSTTNNATLGITNNVNVHATTGDATVASNTHAGNATTGNANTAVNILNLMGSNISLSDWFGILFINVFGSWNGSFGVNTSAGTTSTESTSANQNPVQAITRQNMAQSLRQFASFVSHNTSSQSDTSSTTTTANAPQAVLGSMTLASQKTPLVHSTTKPTADRATHPSFLLLASGIGLSLLILLAGERERFFGRSH
jgi:hypothetical protein